MPWIKSGDLPDGPVTATEEQITELGLQSSAAKLLPPGTVSMALYGATIGKLGILTREAATNQACANVIPNAELVDKWYLFYFLLGERRSFVDLAQGGTQPNISQQIVRDFTLRLAPLAEQRRIVAALEQILGKVASCQTRLARIPTLLKRFRQAVLAAACSGRLTANWREEHASNERRECADIPATWTITTVSDVCVAIVDCPHSTPEWTTSGEVCFRTTNFRVGQLDLSEMRYVSPETYKQRVSRLIPQFEDILYSREGGILGIACQMPSGLRACLGQRMMLMRTNPGRSVPTYLMHVLNSPATTAVVRELTGGTASPHLNVGTIKAFEVPLPPLAEQQEIVRRVDALFAVADQIEARYLAARRHVDRLTQSVLAKAFRGELVPTEHALAAAENRDYEPAKKLLERIRAARPANPAPRRRAAARRPPS